MLSQQNETFFPKTCGKYSSRRLGFRCVDISVKLGVFLFLTVLFSSVQLVQFSSVILFFIIQITIHNAVNKIK